MVFWPGTLLWVSIKAWTDQPIDRLLDWFGLLFGPIFTWRDGTHTQTHCMGVAVALSDVTGTDKSVTRVLVRAPYDVGNTAKH
ncbi:uncharacterized protein LY79DRAFT_546249 [Colletotrichum navitas]|uniref:Uncharacterized protein n=1 Tax=Colletotrichum navitas TaxID=681940 RepID=A0AAD8V8M5_9PEZI|nr:uncharacterized protein LY79DRAFT_546249 [Colletotrichum navitas]KAK1595851.1 hypothetical protein LY79DRAFT_546249 [Colletotrichum navitas]